MNLENKSLKLLIVLWTSSFSINCIPNFERPEITPTDSDIILNVNSNFTLNCSSNEPITWRTGIFKQLESHNTSTKTQAGQYIETIYLKRISARHVGRYFCVKKNALLDVPFYRCDTPNVTCINIFVNDPNVLLVPSDGYSIDAISQEIITIPCKPTNPDIEVELIRPNGQILNGHTDHSEFQTNNDVASFDKYTGFKLRIQNKRDEGVYFCHPKFPSTSNLAEITSCYVFFEVEKRISKNEFADPVRIISFPSAHALLGEKFILRCFVDMDGESVFEIVWEKPNKIESAYDRSKFISLKFRHPYHSNRGFREYANRTVISRRFIITNFQISDEGYYNCWGKKRSGQRTEKASYYVKQLRNGEIFFDKNSPTYFTFFRDTTRTAEFHVNFQSLLTLEFTWTSPKGIRIGGVYDEKFSNFSNELSSYMQIKNISVEDSGEYICTAANNMSMETVKLWVDIRDEPAILVKRSYNIQNGQELQLLVKIIAKHAPTLSNFSLSFIPCNYLIDSIQGNCNQDPVKVNMKKIFEVPRDKANDFTTIFGLVFKLETPGEIQFKVANANGTILGKSYVLIGDIPGNISISGIDPKHEITEGDEVIMTCAALHSLFSYPEWLRNNKEINIYRQILSYDYSKFSYKRIVKFKNITKQDAGEYKCKITEIGTYKEFTESVYIVVNEPEAPAIYETNMEDEVERFVDQSLQLNCKASGKPKPTITWCKDDKQINQSSHVELLENNSILRIQNVNSSDTGVYKCEAKSRSGLDSKSSLVEITEPSNRKTAFAIIIGGIAVVTILVTSFSFYIYKLKKNLRQSVFNNFEEGAIDQLDPNLSLNEQANLLPYNRCYEFPRNRLKLGKQLGSGAFGVVWKGFAERIIENEEDTVVAVKMVKENADHEVLKAFVSELKIMVHLGHHLNVVNLLGAVTENKSEIMIIVEYCQYGCVQGVLLHNRKWFVDQIDPYNDKIDSTISNEICSEKSLAVKSNSSSFNCDPTERIILSTSDLVSWAFQVARGMDYLSSRRILHRDLAARNILLCKDNVVKICDFGLSKSMYKNDNYKKKTDTPLPIKWLALESLADQVYNVLTDVWSFGITLWEIFSLATVPYPGMDTNHEFFTKLRNGYRMEKPPYANQEIYDIMLECWSEDPEQRPLFNELEMKFSKLLDEERVHHYVNLNEPHVKWNTEYHKKIELNYLTIMGTDNEEKTIIPFPIYENEIPIMENEKNPPDGNLPMVSFKTTRNKEILRQMDDGYAQPDRHFSINDKMATQEP